nr:MULTISPECIES: hypothetical protein [unclassified Bradyrhizobium]
MKSICDCPRAEDPNDALKGSFGADAVRYSLLSAAVTTTLGALLFVWAARSIRTDIGRAAA